jgi:hypothetical protein
METNTPESSPKEEGGNPNKITGEEPKKVQPKVGRQMDLEELIKILEKEDEKQINKL